LLTLALALALALSALRIDNEYSSKSQQFLSVFQWSLSHHQLLWWSFTLRSSRYHSDRRDNDFMTNQVKFLGQECFSSIPISHNSLRFTPICDSSPGFLEFEKSIVFPTRGFPMFSQLMTVRICFIDQNSYRTHFSFETIGNATDPAFT
jgi:hypothetical protein